MITFFGKQFKFIPSSARRNSIMSISVASSLLVYYLVIKSRPVTWPRCVATLGGIRGAYSIVVDLERKRPLARRRQRWEDNITIHLPTKTTILHQTRGIQIPGLEPQVERNIYVSSVCNFLRVTAWRLEYLSGS